MIITKDALDATNKDINNSIANDISDKNSKENRLIIFKNIKFYFILL